MSGDAQLLIEAYRYRPRRARVPYDDVPVADADLTPLVLQDWPERGDMLAALLARGAPLPGPGAVARWCRDDQPRFNAAINRVLSLPPGTPGVRQFAEAVVGGGSFGGPLPLPGRRQRADSGEPHGLARVMDATLFETGSVVETVLRAARHPEEIPGVFAATEDLLLRIETVAVSFDETVDETLVPVAAALVAMCAFGGVRPADVFAGRVIGGNRAAIEGLLRGLSDELEAAGVDRWAYETGVRRALDDIAYR